MFNVVIYGIGQVGTQLAYRIAEKTNFDVYGVDYFNNFKQRFIEMYPNREFDGSVFEKINMIEVFNTGFIKNKISDKKTFFMITVPTLTECNKPDYKYVETALKNIYTIIKKDDVILMESSVGVGYTAHFIERFNSINNIDINYGFCPERILPDSNLKIEQISKIVSASKNVEEVYDFYKSFLDGEIIKANNIYEAEACKLIENIQRDINVAYLNECKMMFDNSGLDIDFNRVIDLCRTKYSWSDYIYGMVGGNCIGNNSYYLRESMCRHEDEFSFVKKAREINESYETYVKDKIVDFIKNNSSSMCKILFLGKGYKPNATSSSNSREFKMYFDIVNENNNHNHVYDILDLNVDRETISKEQILNKIKNSNIIIINGRHDFIKEFSDEIKKKKYFDYYGWLDNNE